ncbi:hypothetical protein EVAR_374_1 [Eumeta japonica]|uniref:Uncharacterized protein n=1 Tax=Eumeta variegata TaxID=151549 RepID=A0A4C1SCS7_EUMVA|nr:hypothetical protein EVAR_374_1 [Eumeta japonica]
MKEIKMMPLLDDTIPRENIVISGYPEVYNPLSCGTRDLAASAVPARGTRELAAGRARTPSRSHSACRRASVRDGHSERTAGHPPAVEARA